MRSSLRLLPVPQLDKHDGYFLSKSPFCPLAPFNCVSREQQLFCMIRSGHYAGKCLWSSLYVPLESFSIVWLAGH